MSKQRMGCPPRYKRGELFCSRCPRNEAWKKPENIVKNQGGGPMCPDCGQHLRTHARHPVFRKRRKVKRY